MKKINELELKEIFIKIKLGDENGIQELYEKYHSLVYGVAFSVLKNSDNSEDVTQNVFTNLLKLDKHKFPTQGEASWLYIVTKNEAIQFIRKQKSVVDIDDLYTLQSENDEINDIVDMESYYKLLEKLDPLDKEIVSLRILSDFTFEKIGQMLNKPIGTIEWRYYKALHYIKLSITNLAAFVIVLSVWVVYEREFTDYDKTGSHYNYHNAIRNETTNSYSHSSGGGGFPDPSSFTGDTSRTGGADATVTLPLDAFMFLSTHLVALIFFIIAIVYVFKTKIKKRKKNKKF